jgi:hypothetical protein
MARKRSMERMEFLRDMLSTAIENYGYGWFKVDEYRHSGTDPYAVIWDKEDKKDEKVKYRVDLDGIARGLGVIRNAELREIPGKPGKMALFNVKTGKNLHMSTKMRADINKANRANDSCEGNLDVIAALAVLECGIFGYVAYI